MSDHIHKSHNKSLLLYHFVCPIKYRRKVLSDIVSETFKKVCLEIEEQYEIHYLEIGLDRDHVHFLIQSVPGNAQKNNRSGEEHYDEGNFPFTSGVKRMLWGGKFWTSGYYVNTIGQYANEEVLNKSLQNQGRKKYTELYRNQLKLF